MLKRTILVVDDVKINRVLTKEIFKNDFVVLTANDGVEALKIMHQEYLNIAVVILDIVMPRMNGYEVLETMRKDKNLQELPTVVVTSADDVENEIKALDYGATDVITKPFDSRVLRRRVDNIVQKLDLEEIKIENKLLRKKNLAQIQLQAIMDNIVSGVALVELTPTMKMKALYLNKGYYDYCGFSKREVNKHLDDMMFNVHKDDYDGLLAQLYAAIDSDIGFHYEYRQYNQKGEIKWVQVQGIRIENDDTINPVLITISTDISSMKATEKELKETSTQLKSLINNIPGGITIFRFDERIKAIYYNEALPELLGYDVEEFKQLDNEADSLFFDEDYEYFVKALKSANENNTPISIPLRVKCKDDRTKWFQFNAEKIREEDGVPIYNCVFIDITKEKEEEAKADAVREQLRYRALHDGVTKLYNRETFFEKTEILINSNPSEKYYIVCFNIERFRLINELFGSEKGDEVLRIFSNRLLDWISTVGSCGRLESDNFVACIPQSYYDEKYVKKHLLNENFNISSNYQVIISMGIYGVEDRKTPVYIMCDRADYALSTVKGDYLHRIGFYNGKVRQELIRIQAVSSEMSQAIQDKQFKIYLQPIVEVDTHKIISAEALVRWEHPTKGLISPGFFIPIFEKNGFISELDCYVWEETCQYLKWRKDNNLPTIPISVNVSRRSVFSLDIVSKLIEMTEKYEIDHSLLKIEITESAFVDYPEQLTVILNELKKAGFTILLDDFGSGYSSFNSLKDMPVDILKIDMKFMSDFETSKRAGSIVSSIVRMASWLGINIVAEGVETLPQVEFLHSIGCNSIQGYFFYRPMPLQAFNQLPDIIEFNLSKAIKKDISPFDLNELFTAATISNKLIDMMVNGVAIYEYIDHRLEVIRVSEAYYRMLDFNSSEEFYADSPDVLSFVHPDDINNVQKVIGEVIKMQSEKRLVIRRYGKTGKMLWLDIVIRYLGKSGSIPLLCVVFTDISENVQIINELVKQKDSYQNLVDFIPDGIIKCDTLGKIEFVSDNLLNLFGYTNEEFSTTFCGNFFNIIYPEDLERVRKELKKQFFDSNMQNNNCKFRIQTKDGSLKWVLNIGHGVTDPDGKVMVYAIITDIDEQYNQELLLRKQQEETIEQAAYYQKLYDTLPTAIVQYRVINGKLVRSIFNEAMAKMFNCHDEISLTEQLKGRLILDFYADNYPIITEYVNEAIEIGTDRRFDHPFKFGDSPERWLHTELHADYDHEGARVIQLASFDITANKLAEQTIKQNDLMLQRARDYLLEFEDSLPTGLICFTNVFDFEPIALNQRVIDIFGYKDKDKFWQTLKSGISLLIYPDDEQLFVTTLQAVKASGKRNSADIRGIRADGKVVDLSFDVDMIETLDGQQAFRLVFTDVTEKKRNVEKLGQLTKMLEGVMENLPSGIGVFRIEDDKTIPLYISQRAYQIFGFTEDEQNNLVNNKEFFSFINESDFVKNRQSALEKKTPCETTIETEKRDGSKFWLRMVASLSIDSYKRTICYITFTDVTQKIKAEQAVMKRREIYRMLIEDSDTIIFEYDIATDSLEYSFYAAGVGRKQIVIPNYLKLINAHNSIISKDTLDSYVAGLKKAIKIPGEESSTFRYDFYGTKQYLWYRSHYLTITDKQGNPTSVIGRVQEVDEDVKEMISLRKKASIDYMSGLTNRSHAEGLVKQLLAENSDNTYAFFMLDIDNFKTFNDSYGHPLGDYVIKEVSKCIKASFRKGDIVSRFGGDEYVAFCPVLDVYGAIHKAKILSRGVSKIEIDGVKGLVSISVGISISPDHGETFEKLFYNADVALYEAKKDGKGKIKIFDPREE